MICCCSGSYSGSDFGKVLVPVPASVPVPDPDILSTVFQEQKMYPIHNLAYSVSEAVLGIRIRRIRMFLASRIRTHYSEVRIRLRILPFPHRCVEWTKLLSK
jgi:hypothetical protein